MISNVKSKLFSTLTVAGALKILIIFCFFFLNFPDSNIK